MPASNPRQLEHMRRAIAALPEPTGAVYRLHLLEGLAYDAIAAMLETDLVSVERHIADAIVLIDLSLRRQERGGMP